MSKHKYQNLMLESLEREDLIELKDNVHTELCNLKFQIDAAIEDQDLGFSEMNMEWYRSIKFRQMKTREILRKVTAQLVKVNKVIKEENRKKAEDRKKGINTLRDALNEIMTSELNADELKKIAYEALEKLIKSNYRNRQNDGE